MQSIASKRVKLATGHVVTCTLYNHCGILYVDRPVVCLNTLSGEYVYSPWLKRVFRRDIDVTRREFGLSIIPPDQETL